MCCRTAAETVQFVSGWKLYNTSGFEPVGITDRFGSLFSCPDGRRSAQTRAGMKLYNKRGKHVTAPLRAFFIYGNL